MYYKQLICAIVITVLPNICWAKPSLESRLDRLENMVENQLNVHNLNDLNELKQSLREVQGTFEELKHELEVLRTKQNSLAKELQAKKFAAEQKKTLKQAQSKSTKIELKKQPTLAMPVGKATVEHAAYEAAYDLIEQNKTSEAQIALQDFLWKYPESKYIANAHYWLGEIYLTQWRTDNQNQLLLDKSIDSFKVVLDKYPNHNKAVDCLLKLGLTEIDRENWFAAQEYLAAVKTSYPNSSRAKIASMRLESLQQQGLISK